MSGLSENLPRSTWRHHAALWLVLLLSLSLAWTGFIGSDDKTYTLGALGWLHDFPYVATHFGTIRAVVGIPMALVFAVLGEREFTVPLSTCLFFAATLSVTLAMLARLIGARAALISCMVLSTVPLFALRSTIASADLPELLFASTSFWLYLSACERPTARTRLLVGAGLCAGLAFAAHELTLALLIFYGLLFLVGKEIPRRQYWLMAAGFLAVLGAECVYYAVMIGNPLHRFSLLLVGVAYHDRVHVGFGQIAANGTLHLWDPIDPIVMLLFKHEFGLLGLASLPALWWACVTRRADHTQALRTARLFAGFGFVWMLLTAIVLRNMILGPRYYMLTAYCLFIVVSIWAAVEIRPRRPRLLKIGLALFVGVNVLAIYADNKNPRFGERALVDYMRISSGPIYTDPLTADDMYWFCRWEHVDCGRLVAAPPPPGSLYFYNAKNADRPNRFVSQDKVPLYQPKAEWQLVWTQEEDRKWAGIVLEKLGVAGWLPKPLLARLDRPNPTVKILQLAPAP